MPMICRLLGTVLLVGFALLPVAHADGGPLALLAQTPRTTRQRRRSKSFAEASDVDRASVDRERGFFQRLTHAGMSV